LPGRAPGRCSRGTTRTPLRAVAAALWLCVTARAPHPNYRPDRALSCWNSPVHVDLATERPAERSEFVDTAWVGVIGVAFIGIFTSWFGTQSFAVKLLNTGGAQLGSWLIGIVYVFFILSNQIAPSVVGWIGAKWTMVAGSCGYFLVVAGTASQTDTLTLLGGACVGIGAGLLWSGQGRMVTDLSTDRTRGKCWGIFDALMMGGSGLVGNAITINFAPDTRNATATGSSDGSGDGSDGGDEEFNKQVHEYFTILCFPVAVAIVVLMCIPNLPKPTEQLSITARFQRTWDVATTREMLTMAPYCFHIGVAIGFTVYFNTIIHDNKALGVIGLYNCLGGFLALPLGRLSDTFGRRPIALLAMAMDLVAYYFATVAAKHEHQPHYHGDLMSSIAPGVCGYACFAGLLDGGARSLIQVLQAATISTLFSKKDSEAAFAMQETWLSISSILICCVLTQLLPTTDVKPAVALQHFRTVMGVCAASLVVSTGFYCAAEPSPGLCCSGKQVDEQWKKAPIAGWRKARKSYDEVLIQ
jgi:MFS family permease